MHAVGGDEEDTRLVERIYRRRVGTLCVCVWAVCVGHIDCGMWNWEMGENPRGARGARGRERVGMDGNGRVRACEGGKCGNVWE